MSTFGRTSARFISLMFVATIACGSTLRTVAADDPQVAATGQGVPEQPRPRLERAEALPQDMRDTLARYGTFQANDQFGEVWIPTVTPQGWHPYPPCHWAKVKRLGFYFDDQSEWGKIVHHYGRWQHDGTLGWMWIAGTAFSPGWVVWRSTAKWTGWAPLPPQSAETVATADAMAGADSWLFQETPRLIAGCQATDVAPAVETAALVAETPYVRMFGVFDGIAVFIVPHWIQGPFIDMHVDVPAWPNWYFADIVMEWNWVWHHTTIHNVKNVCLKKI